MPESDDVLNRKYLIPLVYILPTFILYFYILFKLFLGKNKQQYTGSFYKLFGCSAINCMLHSVFYYLIMRAPNAPMFLSFWKSLPTHHFGITSVFILMYYTAGIMHFLDFSISFNRFTVFFLRQSHQCFWKRKLKYVLAFCFSAPCLIVWHFLLTDVGLKVSDPNDAAGYRYFEEFHKENVPWMVNGRNMTIIISICGSLSFGMNIFVLVKLIKYRCLKTIPTKVAPQDVPMFIYTMLIFGTQVVSCVQQFIFITINVNDRAAANAMFNLQYYIADVSTLAPAWFFFITNSTIRTELAGNLLKVGHGSVAANPGGSNPPSPRSSGPWMASSPENGEG